MTHREPSTAVTGTQASIRVTALMLTLGVAGASWAVAVRQMSGMGMGGQARLGSIGLFVAWWAVMMAAMMLPGAAPAAARRAAVIGRVRGVPLFMGSYLAVWTLVGLAVYGLYRPHGSLAAGVAVIAAGVYELTPLKQACRSRCRDSAGSGFQFGLYCVGSSIGLMVILLAVNLMSIAWMSVIAVLVIAQKLVPRRAAFDVPVALAILGLGVLTIVEPATVPALMAPM